MMYKFKRIHVVWAATGLFILLLLVCVWVNKKNKYIVENLENKEDEKSCDPMCQQGITLNTILTRVTEIDKNTKDTNSKAVEILAMLKTLEQEMNKMEQELDTSVNQGKNFS